MIDEKVEQELQLKYDISAKVIEVNEKLGVITAAVNDLTKAILGNNLPDKMATLLAYEDAVRAQQAAIQELSTLITEL